MTLTLSSAAFPNGGRIPQTQVQKEKADANAKREKNQARIEQALAKADDALDRAKAHHEKIAAAIAADQEKLDRRAAGEKKRWDAERSKLEDARERATRD